MWGSLTTGTKSQGHAALPPAKSLLSSKPLQAPEKSSDHAASVMLMRCTCTLPSTTSSISKTFRETKRSTSKELGRRNLQRDLKQHLRHMPYLGVSGAGRTAAKRICWRGLPQVEHLNLENFMFFLSISCYHNTS